MTVTQKFFDYIERATSPIQAVSHEVVRLKEAGFVELDMKEDWMVEPGGSYYVRPYPTTLIALKLGNRKFLGGGYHIITSHTDCPGFKVKPNPDMATHGFLKLNTEVYGGPIFNSWYDRPLSLAGQVMLRSDDPFAPKVALVDFEKALMTIPNLAIHFNREVNKGVAINPQKDMLPILDMLYDDEKPKDYLLKILAEEVDCQIEDILDFDLYVYVRESGMMIGSRNGLASVPRVDNLSMVFASIEALLASETTEGINVAACFDNEEIGSTTKQGADSMLLAHILERVDIALNRLESMRHRSMNASFMISADGAHGVHPNSPEKNDVTNFPILGKGIAVKVSAKQSYSTDGYTSAVLKQLCEKAGVPYQILVNRSDQPGGKTLGPIATKYLPIKAVDMGIPMLAMHSARELFHSSDLEDCIKLFTTYYSSH